MSVLREETSRGGAGRVQPLGTADTSMPSATLAGMGFSTFSKTATRSDPLESVTSKTSVNWLKFSKRKGITERCAPPLFATPAVRVNAVTPVTITSSQLACIKDIALGTSSGPHGRMNRTGKSVATHLVTERYHDADLRKLKTNVEAGVLDREVLAARIKEKGV
jgi:hypothetical protein